MPKPKALMTRLVPNSAIEMLRAVTDLEVWKEDRVAPHEWLMERIVETEGFYCLLTDRVDKELLDKAPRLKIISTMAVGYDHIDVSECTKRGIPVGNTPDVLTETTADFTFSLITAAARRIVEGRDYVLDGKWQTWSPTLLLGQDLHGATLGIVGYGRIGKAVARRAKGFGMKILACHSSGTHAAYYLDRESVEMVDLGRLLSEADFVSLHVPLTSKTYHLIGKREFGLMKQTAILVNTARGSIVDPHVLYDALRQGQIAYAALDVTEPEPIAKDDPLLTLHNCLIMPHIASASVGTRTKMAIMAAENLLAGLKDARVPYCVNSEVYEDQVDGSA